MAHYKGKRWLCVGCAPRSHAPYSARMLLQTPARLPPTPRNAAQGNVIAAWRAADRSAVDALGLLHAELEREELEESEEQEHQVQGSVTAHEEPAHARGLESPADARHGLNHEEACGAGSETAASAGSVAVALTFCARESASGHGAAYEQAAQVAAGVRPDDEWVRSPLSFGVSSTSVSFTSLPSVVTWHTQNACAHQARSSLDASNGAPNQDAWQGVGGVGSAAPGDAGSRWSIHTRDRYGSFRACAAAVHVHARV